MKRIELFKVALEHCENLSQKFPDLEITSSIRKQLKYLISCESTSDIDKSKLESIIIGVQTAREIEPLDLETSEIFYQVANEVRIMLSE